MNVSRRELIVAIGIILVTWLVLLIAVMKWQQRAAHGRPEVEPALLHYPGTESTQEQTSRNLGLRKYWFRLNEEYPSKSVFYFYQRSLEPKGWTPVAEGEPQWFRRESKEEAHDLFRATWLSPDRLFQFDLEMDSVVKVTGHEGGAVTEEREPGILVYVTQRRATMPSFLIPSPAGQPRRGEIELK